GPGGSAIRLLLANSGEDELLFALGLAELAPPSEFSGGIGDEADCCAMRPACSVLVGEATDAVLVLSFAPTGIAGDSGTADASGVSGTPINTPNGLGWRGR